MTGGDADDVGAEWALLELICLGVEDPGSQARVDELLSSPLLSWGELFEQAIRHQLLPMLAFHVLRSPSRDTLVHNVLEHLAWELDLNRHRHAVARAEVARIVRAFDERRLRFVGTKGISLESTIYEARGVRRMKDIDLMVAPADRDAAREAMEALGYQAGVFDWVSGTIQPHPRRAHVRYIVSPDHLPRFVRLTGDPVVRYQYVDVANSLTWSGATYEVPIEDALGARVEQPIPGVDDVALPCFPPHYQFLFTVLHLFREAWLEVWMELGLDVTLGKFADVIRLLRRHGHELCDPAFIALLDSHSVAEPVAWVLEHVDRCFGLDTVREMGLAGRVDEALLAKAHPAKGRPRTWTGDMRQRLRHKNRRQLFRDVAS